MGWPRELCLIRRVYDVGGQRGERQKWVQVFDMCTAILFLVDAGNFDFVLREDSSTLRLLEAAETFEKVWSNRSVTWIRRELHKLCLHFRRK